MKVSREDVTFFQYFENSQASAASEKIVGQLRTERLIQMPIRTSRKTKQGISSPNIEISKNRNERFIFSTSSFLVHYKKESSALYLSLLSGWVCFD